MAARESVAIVRRRGIRFNDDHVATMVKSFSTLVQGLPPMIQDFIIAGNYDWRPLQPETFLVRDLLADALLRCGDGFVGDITSLLTFHDGRDRVAVWALRRSGNVRVALKILSASVTEPATSVAAVDRLNTLGPDAWAALRAAKNTAATLEARELAEHALVQMEHGHIVGVRRHVRSLLLATAPVIGVLLMPYGLVRLWSRKDIVVISSASGVLTGVATAVPAAFTGIVAGWVGITCWILGFTVATVLGAGAVNGVLPMVKHLLATRDSFTTLTSFGAMVIGAVAMGLPVTVGVGLQFEPFGWLNLVIALIGTVTGGWLGWALNDVE
jgi:hypothetical protein